ncbi:MAG: rhomboid family protein, partial [halophilic archaeon J07HB67]
MTGQDVQSVQTVRGVKRVGDLHPDMDADSLVPGTARGQRSPTVETVIVILGVFLIQIPLGLLGVMSLFVVADPTFFAKPWTLLTATYAHAGPGHLVGNLVALFLFGFVVERATSRLRYHAFFILTGAIAAVAEITLGGLVALEVRGVLGASGAIFGLMGYAIAGNELADWLSNTLSAVTSA